MFFSVNHPQICLGKEENRYVWVESKDGADQSHAWRKCGACISYLCPGGGVIFFHTLETDLEVPVITSHQATLWSALRRCGVKDKKPELGKLFTL